MTKDISTNNSAFNIPVLALRVLVQVLFNHTNDNLVRYETASIHDLLSLQTKRSLGGDSSSQHVTSGQVADTELLLDSGSLSTLASAGRAHNDHAKLVLGDALSNLLLKSIETLVKGLNVLLDFLKDGRIFARHYG